MEKLVLAALIGTGLCLLLRSANPEFAFPVGIGTGLVLLWMLVEQGTGLLAGIQTTAVRFGISEPYQKALLKMVVIAYMAQFTADLCRDHQASSIAEKVELGGRICVLTCALPAVVALLENGIAVLSEGIP